MSRATPAPPAQVRELRAGTVVCCAAGSIGTGGFATAPGFVLVRFLTDTLGDPAARGRVRRRTGAPVLGGHRRR